MLAESSDSLHSVVFGAVTRRERNASELKNPVSSQELGKTAQAEAKLLSIKAWIHDGVGAEV